MLFILYFQNNILWTITEFEDLRKYILININGNYNPQILFV